MRFASGACQGKRRARASVATVMLGNSGDFHPAGRWSEDDRNKRTE
jgi:hypothetical protein